MVMLSSRAARTIDSAAGHLGAIVCRYDSTAEFASTSLVVLAQLERYLPLSAELRYWYHTRAPAHVISMPDLKGTLQLFPPGDLLARQIGLRWRALPAGERGRRIEEWPASWIAIGSRDGAPIIAETGAPDTPVGLAHLHANTWAAALLAPTLADFLEALGHWLAVTLSATGALGAAEVAFSGGVAWRAGGGDTPELRDALARALMPLLPAEAVVAWLPPSAPGDGVPR